MCSHKKHKHMASKQITSHVQNRTYEHAANEKTHKPRSHKTWQHESTQPMNNMNCVQHNETHVDRRACGRANSRPHTPTKRQNMECECPNPDTNRNSRHECRDPNTTLQHETTWLSQVNSNERAYGSSTLEATRSHENRTWREYQGSVTKPWITLDRSDRTLTTLYSVGLVTQKKLYITHYYLLLSKVILLLYLLLSGNSN